MRAVRVAMVAGVVAAFVIVASCSSSSEGDHETVAVDAPTCAPSLAMGAVPAPQHAMLDLIAFTEGTAGTCGEDGYNTGFAFHCFASCDQHPSGTWTASGITSSAAGRYQFISATWAGLGLTSFSPANQDLGAMMRITQRGVTLPATRALTSDEFTDAMMKLSLEWASLPFSPYGQPRVTIDEARTKYCALAGGC